MGISTYLIFRNKKKRSAKPCISEESGQSVVAMELFAQVDGMDTLPSEIPDNPVRSSDIKHITNKSVG